MRFATLNRWTPRLNIVAALALLTALGFVFFYAPVERTMGNVQRIFYFHVGTAWVGAVAFFVALVCGVRYLRRPAQKWDTVSLASVEIGLIFLTMATVAGSVWGKPAWNTWWIWTPRLTLVTIALLTYAAYFMLRGAIENEGRRARFAAVYVIVAFVTIITAYLSIRFLRDIHPTIIGGTLESAQGQAEGLQEFAPGIESMRMGITLTVSTFSFTAIYIAWMLNRIRLQLLLDRVAQLKGHVQMRLSGGD